jgi:hypothetical protein
MAIQTLIINSETAAEQSQRNLTEQKEILESKLQALYGKRNRGLETVARVSQLENREREQQRAVEEQRTNPKPMTFDQLEDIRRAAHETGQEILEARPAAESAARGVQALDAEILNLQDELGQIDRRIFDHRTIELFRSVMEPVENFIQAQRELDAHIETGRNRDYRLQNLGILLMPHPAASRTDRRDHAVKDYLRFSLAGIDPKFSETLHPDEPASRMLRAARGGSGISAPALIWG